MGAIAAQITSLTFGSQCPYSLNSFSYYEFQMIRLTIFPNHVDICVSLQEDRDAPHRPSTRNATRVKKGVETIHFAQF